MLTAKWVDYEILDAGDGEKLERWGDVVLLRPEPQAIWPKLGNKITPDAHYIRSSNGGGHWEFARELPQSWQISYGKLKFLVHPTAFKHTGLFPEQSENWDYMAGLLKKRRGAKVLNLFAYTGGATIACAAAGAFVTHVDSAKGMVARAKENAALNGIAQTGVRYLVDDVQKFVQRERRRGNTYDAIVMDPPSYGRGPGKELWKLEQSLVPLINECIQILSPTPLFFVINSYTMGLSPQVISNLVYLMLQKRWGGRTFVDYLGLAVGDSPLVLPCGVTGRWEA
ncbi:MAG: class I SAM-dependent methyltransferase [Christensenellales bacterium]|jgi:23S rRNA (cytosine1962-C5)-methyltransferase